jgi:hypothetical protein
MVAFREDVPGRFTFDPDLVVDELHLASCGTVSKAAGKIWTGPVRSAIATDPSIRTRMTRQEIELRLRPDQRIAIGFEAVGDVARQYLLVGYPNKFNVAFNAAPGNVRWDETWQVESALGREQQAPGRTIQGQLRMTEALALALNYDWFDMTTFDAIDPEALAVTDPVKVVQSERCIFNPEGRPNRSRRPVKLPYPERFDEDATTVEIYTFEDVDSPRAEKWTYFQALQYLWWCAMRDSTVRAGDLFDPESALNVGISGVPTHLLAPEEVGSGSSHWNAQLVRYCESFCPEGKLIVEALALLGQLCGLRFRERLRDYSTTNQQNETVSEPVAFLQCWVPGDNTFADWLEAEVDGSPLSLEGAPRDADSDVLMRNNTSNARVNRDWTNVANRARVLGDRQFVVLRVELWPMWKPDALWDNVAPSGVTALVDDAKGADDFKLRKDSTFYAFFHPSGADFCFGQNSIVGRLWGIDWAGELAPMEYNRASGPYAGYGSIDWAALGQWGAAGVPTNQVRRRRQLMPLPAKSSTGETVGVLLEVSWNAGTSWYRINTKEWKTIPERSAVLLTPPDSLLAFGKECLDRIAVPPIAYPVRNYYEAYLKNLFRMRVTAAVDLDERVEGTAADPWTTFGLPGPLGSLTVERTVLRTGDFKRVDTRRFLDQGFVGSGEIDQTLRAGKFAAGVLQPALAPRVASSASMPWLDTEQRYPIGTPIAGIRRSPTSTDQDLSFTAYTDDVNGMRPEVIGKILRQSIEGASTELVLEEYVYAPAYK